MELSSFPLTVWYRVFAQEMCRLHPFSLDKTSLVILIQGFNDYLSTQSSRWHQNCVIGLQSCQLRMEEFVLMQGGKRTQSALKCEL